MVMKVDRLTVKKMKELLEEYKVPDDAIIACQSDEEGNRTMVCMDMWIDKVGRQIEIRDGYGVSRFTAGEEVMGIELDKDKDKTFITFVPMY